MKRHRYPSMPRVKENLTYSAWQNMRQRCSNPNHHRYKNYGGRGIKVCNKWQSSFAAFLADMGECPSRHTLDRINNDGNYEPGNCRWATATQQQRNRRDNHIVEVNGKQLPLREAVERFGAANYHCVHLRITRYGWSIDKALNTPSRIKSGRINQPIQQWEDAGDTPGWD